MAKKPPSEIEQRKKIMAKINKQTLFTILYIGLIVGLIAFMIFLVIWLKSESYVCLKDPIQYYSEKQLKCVIVCGIGGYRVDYNIFK